MSRIATGQNRVNPSPAAAALVALMLAGAALRFWGIRFGLPHPFARPDEEVLVDAALGTLRDLNPRFFDWPSFFMYVTGAAYGLLFALERAVGGPIRTVTLARTFHEPLLHLIPRLLAAAAGTATIPVLYAASRELFTRRVALAAAGFLACAYLHVRDSHFGVTDVPVTLLVVAAFLAALRCARRGVTVRRTIAAGALGGLATSTKYNAALVLLPALIAIVQQTGWSQPRRTLRFVGLLFVSAAVFFVAGTPFAVLDHTAFLAAVLGVRNHLASGHVAMANGWVQHASFTLRYGLGLPLLVAALAGAACLIVRDRGSAALVLAFPVVYYVVLGSGQTVFVRYMMPIVPFLCLMAALSVDEVARIVERQSRSSRTAAAAAGAIAVTIAAPSVASSVAFDRLMARTDTRVIAAEWIAARFPAGASMYQSGYGYGHVLPRPISRFPQLTLREEVPGVQFDGQLSPGWPDIVVLLESPIGTYTQVPPAIAQLVADRYELAATIVGIQPSGDNAARYDQDDAFFAPYYDIDRAERPGPNIGIYLLRGAQ